MIYEFCKDCKLPIKKKSWIVKYTKCVNRCYQCIYLKNKERLLANSKSWRENNKQRYNDYQKKYAQRDYVRLKNRTRVLSRYHLYAGNIKKLPCIVCGSKKSEIHHKDYSKPMDITWLCKKCHFAEHRDIRLKKNLLLVQLNQY